VESEQIGEQIVAALGEGASRELLDAITRSVEDRVSLIGRLSQRDDATWLAELLSEIESDPQDITRLRLIDALEEELNRQPGSVRVPSAR
jgi:hypothetical protein